MKDLGNANLWLLYSGDLLYMKLFLKLGLCFQSQVGYIDLKRHFPPNFKTVGLLRVGHFI